MRKRVNITLPEETIELIDRVSEKGDRSRLIDQAVRYFVREHKKASLRELIKQGAVANADRDLALAKEWFEVDESLESQRAWPKRRR
jgi:CopG family transcriptional regulator/antitoxin EndoAI